MPVKTFREVSEELKEAYILTLSGRSRISILLTVKNYQRVTFTLLHYFKGPC